MGEVDCLVGAFFVYRKLFVIMTVPRRLLGVFVVISIGSALRRRTRILQGSFWDIMIPRKGWVKRNVPDANWTRASFSGLLRMETILTYLLLFLYPFHRNIENAVRYV